MDEEILTAPQDIKFDAVVEDICFHPRKDVIAAASINGPVYIYSYSTKEKNHQLLTFNHHKKACRAIKFSDDGTLLYSVSKDKSLQCVDLEQGSLKNTIPKAHSSPIYSLLCVDANIVATGDEDGCLKVWDVRLQKSVMEIKQSEEFISDMKVENAKRILLATSGEGTLTAFDIRKHKLILQSELFDAELLSLAIVKNESKVVVGDGDGNLYLFNWKQWGNISDRFPGHPESIDCIVPINENTIITGSMDGCVRAVSILPNAFLGVLGEHDGFPIENLSLSRCKKYVSSCSHDQCVKFWDLESVKKEQKSNKNKVKISKINKDKKLTSKDNDFFADLAESSGANIANEDNNSNDSNESDDSESDDDISNSVTAIQKKSIGENLNEGGNDDKKDDSNEDESDDGSVKDDDEDSALEDDINDEEDTDDDEDSINDEDSNDEDQIPSKKIKKS